MLVNTSLHDHQDYMLFIGKHVNYSQGNDWLPWIMNLRFLIPEIMNFPINVESSPFDIIMNILRLSTWRPGVFRDIQRHNEFSLKYA